MSIVRPNKKTGIYVLCTTLVAFFGSLEALAEPTTPPPVPAVDGHGLVVLAVGFAVGIALVLSRRFGRA